MRTVLGAGAMLAVMCAGIAAGAALIDWCVGAAGLETTAPTAVEGLFLRTNATAYSLVYRPDGDEATVWIEPLVPAAGLDAGGWVARPGVVAAAPTGPVVYAGAYGDGYARFRLTVEDARGLAAREIDLPAAVVARGAAP